MSNGHQRPTHHAAAHHTRNLTPRQMNSGVGSPATKEFLPHPRSASFIPVSHSPAGTTARADCGADLPCMSSEGQQIAPHTPSHLRQTTPQQTHPRVGLHSAYSFAYSLTPPRSQSGPHTPASQDAGSLIQRMAPGSGLDGKQQPVLRNTEQHTPTRTMQQPAFGSIPQRPAMDKQKQRAEPKLEDLASKEQDLDVLMSLVRRNMSPLTYPQSRGDPLCGFGDDID
jgi:hypothetical protein